MRIARPVLFLLVASIIVVPASAPSLAARKSKPGRLRPRAVYVGTTSQATPVRLRLSNDAKRVAQLHIVYQNLCDGQLGSRVYTDVLNSMIRRGAFSVHGVYRGSKDGSHNVFSATGKLDAHAARGTFTLTATGVSQNGQHYHCSSGALAWTATLTSRLPH